MRRKIRTDAIVAFAGIALVVLFAILQAQTALENSSVPSTYDMGANGYAALYRLLAAEHLSVSRFETPFAELKKRKGSFVIAGDDVLFSLPLSGEVKTLDTWAKQGGTLVLIGSRPVFSTLGLPDTHATGAQTARSVCALAHPVLHVEAPMMSAAKLACVRDRSALLASGSDAPAMIYRRGKGWIVYLTSTAIADNAHVTRADNAAFAYALFSAIQPVAFDERAYGYATDKSTWEVLPAPVHYAIGVALFALLLGLVGANVRFAPAVETGERHVRDSSEYLQSLAALLQRGSARVDVIRRFTRAMERFVAGRHAGAQARALLEQARSLSLRVDADDRDVVAAAQLYTRLRKDMK